MLGFYFVIQALVMIPPSNAATLRTSQIIVAFVAQVLINHNIPAVIDVLGAAFIFLAAMTVTFENEIYKALYFCCPCYCCRPEVTVTISAAEPADVRQDVRPQAPGRVRVVSISMS